LAMSLGTPMWYFCIQRRGSLGRYHDHVASPCRPVPARQCSWSKSLNGHLSNHGDVGVGSLELGDHLDPFGGYSYGSPYGSHDIRLRVTGAAAPRRLTVFNFSKNCLAPRRRSKRRRPRATAAAPRNRLLIRGLAGRRVLAQPGRFAGIGDLVLYRTLLPHSLDDFGRPIDCSKVLLSLHCDQRSMRAGFVNCHSALHRIALRTEVGPFPPSTPPVTKAPSYGGQPHDRTEQR